MQYYKKSYIHIRLSTIQCYRFYATDPSTATVNFEAFRKASLSTLHTPLSALYGSKLTFAGGGGGKYKPSSTAPERQYAFH